MNKWAKWVVRFLLGLLVLLILLLLLIHTQPVRNFIRGKLESYLSKKTNSEIHIASINYRLPKWVELDGVFFKDKRGDTLLYGNKVRVDVNMLKLIKGEYQVRRIELSGVTINIHRSEQDSLFNFQYIVDAFSSKTPAPQQQKQSKVSLSLDQLEIANTSFKWLDQYGGTLIDTRIGRLNVDINELDIYTQKYDIKRAGIADTRFDLRMLVRDRKSAAIAVSDSAKESILPRVLIKDLAIERSHFAFDGQASGLHTVNEINSFSLQGLALAAPQKISLDRMELKNSNLLLDRNIIEKAFAKIKEVDTVTSNLAAVIKQAKFFNDTIAYNNPSTKRQAQGFDMNHVRVMGFNAGFADLGYGDNTIKAKVDSMKLKEQSGFMLDSLHGSLTMKNAAIYLDKLLIKTPFSRIAGTAVVYPQTIDAKYKGNQPNHLVFTNNTIAKNDLVYFFPEVMNRYRSQLQGVSFLYLTTDIVGNPHKAVIRTLSVHSNKNDIDLTATGTVSNVMSKDVFGYDLSIKKLTVNKSFLEPFVTKAGRQTVNLPPLVTAAGKLKGDMRRLSSDLTITSVYGQASFKGQLRNFTNPDKLGYDMRIIAKDLETGKWINKDSLLGKLNGVLLVKGTGIDYQTASIESIVDLSSFRIQQHNYTDIRFNIAGTHGAYDIKGGVGDSLLKLNMDVKTDLSSKYPAAVGKMNVANADLFALGFYKEPLRFRSMIDLQAKDLSPQTLNASVRLDSTIIYQEKRTIRVDSLVAKGSIDSGKTLLSVQSHFADAFLKGDYRYTELPSVLQNILAKYSKTSSPVTPVTVSLQLDANFKPDPIYALLLPGLFFDKNIHANGAIDTRQKDSTLRFYITAPVIAYNTNRLSNLDVRGTGLNDSLKYTIHADTVRASSLQLYTTSVTGGMSKGNLVANFTTNDAKKKEKYAMSVSASMDNDSYQIHLGDKLKLNYAEWNVDNKNRISYGPQGINVSQFNLSRGGESIAVNSSSAAGNAPIDVKIDRFPLQNITGLLDRDSLEIGGKLTAQLRVEGLDKPVPLFNGNVKIDSLQYQTQMVGNIEMEGRSDNNEAVTFDGRLAGYGNNVELKGNYNQDKIDAQVNLNPIELKSIEPFTQKNITRSSGRITGNVNITGPVKNPEWNGTLHFDSVYTQLAKYGTVMRINGQQIGLKYPVITLNQFTIQDSLGHNFMINGTLTKQESGLQTNLTAKTRNFTVLDNTAVANHELYGKAIVDVDVIVNGPAGAPDITGNVGLKDQSAVTFVREQQVASAKDREGVMEFVDMDTIHNYVFRPNDSSALKRSRYDDFTLNYNLNIDIDKNARFSIIIDPLTRDELQVQGSGQLNAAVNPNGDISLTGAYNLTKGSYQLNYKFLKRKFELQEGSTIVLSGDPKNAEANITATYEIEASPYDLLANEISDNTNNIVYKQKIPFEVVLHIKGKAIEPDLSFDVQLRENVSGVNSDMATTIDNKLAQMRGDASTMNKQVFALLVMGRFIGEQSKDFFGSSSGNGLKADQVVKESVSRFLSDAVSQVAADLLKGVEVDIDLKTVDNYTDATQRTDLNLALSKRFLNDRLSISVGKNFTVEGEDPLAKGQDNANISFLPDITTTYKLSKDGRYMLKAYQKSDYEAILDGYFIETGIAFTLTMDYNRFKEIFRKNRSRSEAEKANSRKKETPKETEPAKETQPAKGNEE